jgi:hypothetical protein
MAEAQPAPVPEIKPTKPVKPLGGVEMPKFPEEHIETYHEDVLEGNDPKLRGMPSYQEPRVVRKEKQRIVRR